MAEIITNSKATQVTQLRVSTLDGHQFFVKAQLFILATGGIENPRLLLASNRTQKEGPRDKVFKAIGIDFIEQIGATQRPLLGFRRRHKVRKHY
jgi:choline dehydrogenase-like flavoprotein